MSCTILCFVLVAGVWYVGESFLLDVHPASGFRLFVLLLVHIGMTMLLGRQVAAFGTLYDETARHSPWHLKLAAQIWVALLLLLTRMWLLTDFALLLFWLLGASSRATNQPWF
ncbi:hypothetical protein [Hymenobacter edaphi]|nr:hypothetical protein [Hymenobacter edaphi]